MPVTPAMPRDSSRAIHAGRQADLEVAEAAARSVTRGKSDRDSRPDEIAVENMGRREQAAGRQRRALSRIRRSRAAGEAVSRKAGSQPLPEIRHFAAKFYECCAKSNVRPLTLSEMSASRSVLTKLLAGRCNAL
jgi:hypothetical protein